MSSPFKRLAPLAALAFTLLSPSEAFAKKGFALITRGDTISELGTATKTDVKLQSNKVGFKYSYFGVFWLDLWNYDGEYCVYSGDTYWPISESEAKMLLGKEPSKPFNYKFPLGLLIIGALVVFVIIGAVLKPKGGKAEDTAALMADPRYQEALQTALTEPDAEPAVKKAAFNEAVQVLTANGIEESLARKNLSKLVMAHTPPGA